MWQQFVVKLFTPDCQRVTISPGDSSFPLGYRSFPHRIHSLFTSSFPSFYHLLSNLADKERALENHVTQRPETSDM